MLKQSSQKLASMAGAPVIEAALFEPLSIEALRFILANLRREDLHEIVSTLPERVPFTDIASILCQQSLFGAVIRHRGQPAAAIGVVENWSGVWEGWSWGTADFSRCHGAMAEWCRAVLMPAVQRLGVHRIHVKALAGHGEAHRWIEWLGLTREGDHPGYGRFAETFVTFAWTAPYVQQQQAQGDLSCR